MINDPMLAGEAPSRWYRAADRLAFWRPRRDMVAVSVLAPPVLALGGTTALAVFAHDGAEAIEPLAGVYFPAHRLVQAGALRRPVARGVRLTLHVALPGLTVEPPVHKFVWHGQPLPLSFTAAVPGDFRPGEIVGVLSLAEAGDVRLSYEFPVLIGRG